ncbi:MAG: hypothetical protein V1676_02505 [Candidatus Diapherotrites archaeon]
MGNFGIALGIMKSRAYASEAAADNLNGRLEKYRAIARKLAEKKELSAEEKSFLKEDAGAEFG